jgi:hypothetical protein
MGLRSGEYGGRNGTVINFVYGRAVEHLRRHGFNEALAKDDGELGLGYGPFTWLHLPLFFGSVQDQIEWFCRRLIAWEVSPDSDSPSQL